MAIAVPTETHDWLEPRLRRRAFGQTLFSVLCAVALGWLITWWIEESRVNDHLREVGVETEAVVIEKKSSYRRAPRVRATIVDYTFAETTYRGRLNHSASERVGQTMPILVDPADPASIRALNRANSGFAVPAMALAALVLAALSAVLARTHARARRILRDQDFHAGGLVVDNWRTRRRHRQKLTLVAAGERYEIRGGTVGVRGGDLVSEAIYATDQRHVLALVPHRRVAAFGRVFGATRLPTVTPELD